MVLNYNLKPCPFCEGEAEIKSKRIYYDRGYIVACSKCGARTNIIIVNHPKATETGVDETTRYTDEQTKKIVIDAWNRRGNI